MSSFGSDESGDRQFTQLFRECGRHPGGHDHGACQKADDGRENECDVRARDLAVESGADSLRGFQHQWKFDLVAVLCKPEFGIDLVLENETEHVDLPGAAHRIHQRRQCEFDLRFLKSAQQGAFLDSNHFEFDGRAEPLNDQGVADRGGQFLGGQRIDDHFVGSGDQAAGAQLGLQERVFWVDLRAACSDRQPSVSTEFILFTILECQRERTAQPGAGLFDTGQVREVTDVLFQESRGVLVDDSEIGGTHDVVDA